MPQESAHLAPLSSRPICVALTCWRWERHRTEGILRLARRLDVTVHIRERIHGLKREIEAEVTGRNSDRFIGEFVRHA